MIVIEDFFILSLLMGRWLKVERQHIDRKTDCRGKNVERKREKIETSKGKNGEKQIDEKQPRTKHWRKEKS